MKKERVRYSVSHYPERVIRIKDNLNFDLVEDTGSYIRVED